MTLWPLESAVEVKICCFQGQTAFSRAGFFSLRMALEIQQLQDIFDGALLAD